MDLVEKRPAGPGNQEIDYYGLWKNKDKHPYK